MNELKDPKKKKNKTKQKKTNEIYNLFITV